MGRRWNNFNNFIVRRVRRSRVKPEELLLLFSSCLQKSTCKHKVTDNLENCQRCGACVVSQMIELAEKTGVRPFIATGGRLAAAQVRKKETKAVVAVACCKELSEGLLATFPKPVLAVELQCPNGPCKDTCVEFERVREAVEFFIRDYKASPVGTGS